MAGLAFSTFWVIFEYLLQYYTIYYIFKSWCIKVLCWKITAISSWSRYFCSYRPRFFFFLSAPMSWRIWECAAALLERISISPLPHFSAAFPLMSRWSSDMLTRTFMLTQFSQSLENILLPAARVQEDFFIFTVSIYNRSEASVALLNSWTPVYITNEPLDCYSHMLTGKRGALSLCVCETNAALSWRFLGPGLL